MVSKPRFFSWLEAAADTLTDALDRRENALTSAFLVGTEIRRKDSFIVDKAMFKPFFTQMKLTV
jgi:hypothetical protein